MEPRNEGIITSLSLVSNREAVNEASNNPLAVRLLSPSLSFYTPEDRLKASRAEASPGITLFSSENVPHKHPHRLSSSRVFLAVLTSKLLVTQL